MLPTEERLATLASQVPVLAGAVLLEAVSPFDFHEETTSELAEPWEAFIKEHEIIQRWLSQYVCEDEQVAGGPAWYLHCSGAPRVGKTTFVEAIARHLCSSPAYSRQTTAVVSLFFDSHDIGSYTASSELSGTEAVLRSILRQLLGRLHDDLQPHLGRKTATSFDVGFEQLKQLITTAVGCFETVFVLVDDIHETCKITGCSEAQFAMRLRDLGISFVLFTGPPLNRLSRQAGPHSVNICDSMSCEQEGVVWAECETCNRYYCPTCYQAGIWCSCQEYKPVTRRPSAKDGLADAKEAGAFRELDSVVEIILELDESQIRSFLDDGLSQIYEHDDDFRDGLVYTVADEVSGSLPLARLALDAYVEAAKSVQIQSMRDRLPLYALRYFNLAFWRVESQDILVDKELGLAALAIVSLAGRYPISYHGLLGALACQPNFNRFGAPLNRARISRVTQGWLNISPQSAPSEDTETSLFHLWAQTYLYEERIGFHKDVLGNNRDMALVCLKVLIQYLRDHTTPEHDAELTGSAVSSKAFLIYAMQNWAQHFKERPSKDAMDAAKEFLRLYQHRTSWRLKAVRLRNAPQTVFVRDNIHWLAELGLEDLIDKIVEPESSGHLNVADPIFGRTPAMLACQAGHTNFVRTLLANAEVDFAVYCKRDCTALWYAVQNAHLEIVKLVLEKGDSNLINMPNGKERKNVAMLAVELNAEFFSPDLPESRKYSEVLEALLDCEYLDWDAVDVRGWTLLHICAARADNASLTQILQRADGKRMINKCEQHGLRRSALMVLLSDTRRIGSDHEEAVDLLIKHGATAATSDAKGRTLLHYVARSDKYSNILDALLKAGLKSSTLDNEQDSCVHLARAYGCKTIENALQCIMDLSKESTPNSALDEVSFEQVLDYSALHSAVSDASIVRVAAALSSGGTTVNAITIHGDTAMHLALQTLDDTGNLDEDAVETYVKIIELLLEQSNIDLNIANDFQERAIDIAMKLLDRETLVLDIMEASLRDPGTRLAVQFTDVDRYFRRALEGEKPRSARLIQALLEAGASVFHPVDERTSRDVAKTIAEQRGLDQSVIDALVKWELDIIKSLQE